MNGEREKEVGKEGNEEELERKAERREISYRNR